MKQTKTSINNVEVIINVPNKVWCDYCGDYHENGLDCYEEDLINWSDER